MRPAPALSAALLATLVAGCLAPAATEPSALPPDAPAETSSAIPAAFPDPAAREVARTDTAAQGVAPRSGGALDAVVVAVIDIGFNPYHLDWHSDLLPQHLDADPANDLPLDHPPHTWLPGFPDPAGFASYQPLPLTLARDGDDNTSALLDADQAVWEEFPVSDADEAHYRWVPGTKVVGMLGYFDAAPASPGAHGARTSAAAAGNLFGTCPECLLVFIDLDFTEDPVRWALDQPWIDVVTNSWSSSDTTTGLPYADRHFRYTACDVDQQRLASERGMTLFWSGSNGLVPGAVPITTLQSCHFGPDWMVTVGGIAPSGGNMAWTGKPVDIAAPAEAYPTQGAPEADASATIGGTSAATPVTAGLYARALWQARTTLGGPSRVQADGVVAVGAPHPCGEARAACELGDGVLTAPELRTRFLHAAVRTPEGLKPLTPVGPVGPAVDEAELLSEGHGSFWGRFHGDEGWAKEVRRMVGPMLGSEEAPSRPQGEREWMVVDSWCRQRIWGAWSGGYHVEGETALPGPDPVWPARSAYEASCPVLEPLLGSAG